MIQLHDIHKHYRTGDQSLHVLKGVDLHIREGELVAIMGSSGSGKSTLLNILGILDSYDRGSYTLAGQPVNETSIARAADIARASVKPITDMRGTADYRRHLCGVLTRRALEAAVQRAREGKR